MRAALLREYGQPLELIDRPDPEPTRADHVLVKVGGAGVCATDLHAMDGLMEGAGVLSVLSPGARRPRRPSRRRPATRRR
jgi:D-arabinose 1-dehydrogenase-like Zn-dependent alcohol dehydrogenase